MVLASASFAADAGELAFNACTMCHSIDPKVNDLPGPNLAGVLCRKPGSLKDFEYSEGMIAFAKLHAVWTPALVDEYLADPGKMIADTPMELPRGSNTPEKRRALVAYLQQHGGDAAKACPN